MYWQNSELIVKLHLIIGWISISLGIISGALMGLFFHLENWLGGYASLERRMIRLGHISFFGMAFLNLSLALTLSILTFKSVHIVTGSIGLIVATVSMPVVCFYSSIRGINQIVFSIPVIGTITLIASVIRMLININ